MEESLRFYTEVFGMERLPSPDFGHSVEWLRLGDQQLHLFQSEREPGIWSSPSDCRGHGRGKPGESKADLGSNGHSREPYAGVERP